MDTKSIKEELKAGDLVELSPVRIQGEVIQLRAGLAETDEEGEQIYRVKFPEQTMYVRRKNLVPLEKHSDKPVRNSREWCEEMSRFAALAETFSMADANNSKQIIAQIIESGSRLGFFVPNK